jgi:hypothetical protein
MLIWSSRRLAAFEVAMTAGQSAVERELVLRLASLLWLHRATTIESGLYKIQARHLLQFRQRRQAHQKHQEIIDGVYRNALATAGGRLGFAAAHALDYYFQPFVKILWTRVSQGHQGAVRWL